ncbi:uncharacterized protein LOC135495001 [Lineus longissimus]|uniref:uncharacterized protein LOC135495001 n=1 Tax=Lineus longissimus TaxID=88925 RepID=UPI00315D3520
MIKDAKNYNNVINEKLIGIRLNQVCVPYLHILLGVVKKHHEMLEEECHTLDLLIAEDQARHGGLTNEEGLYATYVESVRRLQKLESRISRKKAVLEQYDENTTIGQLAQQTGDKRSLEKRIEKLEKEKTDLQKTAVLHKGTGKVASELDVVLNRHNICRQAYHGKSLIGNHCAHYLKPVVFEDLGTSLMEKTAELSGDADINQKAEVIAEKFNTLNSLLSEVHEKVGHAKPVPEDEIQMIEVCIQKYLNFYRRRLKGRIFPKLHFLEDHVVAWIKLWGFGMGLMGEQGGESIHAEINRIQRINCAVSNKLQKYASILKEHHTHNHPELKKKGAEVCGSNQKKGTGKLKKTDNLDD